MGGQNHPPRTVVIERLPIEIDLLNAPKVGAQLRGACAADAIVVADMTSTTFCDSPGTQAVVDAHRHAEEMGCEFRVALPAGNVLRVWQIMGVDRALAIYPTVAAAAAQVRRRRSYRPFARTGKGVPALVEER